MLPDGQNQHLSKNETRSKNQPDSYQYPEQICTAVGVADTCPTILMEDSYFLKHQQFVQCIKFFFFSKFIEQIIIKIPFFYYWYCIIATHPFYGVEISSVSPKTTYMHQIISIYGLSFYRISTFNIIHNISTYKVFTLN